jgi:hypothetical protein
MTSVTVTPDPGNVPPRYLIQVTGAAGSTATVYRRTGAGDPVPVRTANPAELIGGDWTGYDYEASYGQAVFYDVVESDGTTTTTTAAALREWGVQTPWLIHPGIPSLSRPLKGVTVGDETQDSTQAAHVVLERRDPVVLSDGVRHLPTFQLTVKTFTTADENDLMALLADGGVLLLQVLFPFTTLFEYWWVSIGTIVKARQTMDFGEPYKLWTLPCTASAPPTGSQQSERVWSDLLVDFDTWADVKVAYATWADLLIDHRA